MIYLDNDTSIELGFDYMEIASKVVNHTLEVENCPFDVSVNILLTDNDGIHQYNLECRGIDRPTDVLSFPNLFFEEESNFDIDIEHQADYMDPETGLVVLGDIVVSLDKVKEQSKEYGHSMLREYAFLIAHSMLHLCGYDHEDDDMRKRMESKQNRILDDLNITRD